MTVVRSNLQYPPQWPSQPAAEKGIDVALAVNVVKYAMLGNIDAAIVFTSDKDIPPAIELVYADTPCHVELACWSGGRRLRFEGTQAPWCHFLKESDFLSIRDLTAELWGLAVRGCRCVRIVSRLVGGGAGRRHAVSGSRVIPWRATRGRGERLVVSRGGRASGGVPGQVARDRDRG